MGKDRWMEVREGQLLLVTELDGWAYIKAAKRGKQTRWYTPTTLEEIASIFGIQGRLHREATALLDQEQAHG